MSTRADPLVSQSSAATATSELNQLRVDNSRLASQVSTLISTANDLRPQLSNARFFIFPTALASMRNEQDRYLALLRFSLCQIGDLDSGFTAMLTRACDSRPSFRRGVRPLLEEFRALVDGDGGPGKLLNLSLHTDL